MIVYLDGKLVPEENACVSILDRSFLYGDGLFETLRICAGKPFRWADHYERLLRGAQFLMISMPLSSSALLDTARQLTEQNHMSDAILRINLSRGVGKRGYSVKEADKPTLVMSLHLVPSPVLSGEESRIVVVTSKVRLRKSDPLAAFKICSMLPQVVARMEADHRGADEALVLNEAGEPIEATAANLFWIRDGVVYTPPLTEGVMPGVTRKVVLEICGKLGLQAREGGITLAGLHRAEGIFLTQTSRGVVEVAALDGEAVRRSELTGRLRAAYDDAVVQHCR